MERFLQCMFDVLIHTCFLPSSIWGSAMLNNFNEFIKTMEDCSDGPTLTTGFSSVKSKQGSNSKCNISSLENTQRSVELVQAGYGDGQLIELTLGSEGNNPDVRYAAPETIQEDDRTYFQTSQTVFDDCHSVDNFLESNGYKVVSSFLNEGIFSTTTGLIVQKKDQNFLAKICHSSTGQYEAWEGLNHGNIVPLVQLLHNEHNLICITEYYDSTLASYLSTIHPPALNEMWVGWIFRQIFNAVEYLHGRHLAHTQLRLDNVILLKNFHIKLSDLLNIAYCPDESHYKYAVEITTDTLHPREIHYCCPESLVQGSPYHQLINPFSVDLYRMGVILYFLVQGKFPWETTENNTYQDQPSKQQVYELKSKVAVKFSNSSSEGNLPVVSKELQFLLKTMLQPNVKLRTSLNAVKYSEWMLQLQNTPKFVLRPMLEEKVLTRQQTNTNTLKEMQTSKLFIDTFASSSDLITVPTTRSIALNELIMEE